MGIVLDEDKGVNCPSFGRIVLLLEALSFF